MKNLVFVNNKKHGEEASMVMQRTVNPPPRARLVRSQYSPPSIGLVVQLVRVPACHAGRCGFESRPDRQGGVAHLVERLLCKQDVAGSSPVTSTNLSRVGEGVSRESHKL